MLKNNTLKARCNKGYFFILFCNIFCQISYSQSNTWTGNTDNNWHRTCNWSLNLIPTSAHNVIIPNNSNYPVITGNAHCRTLSITSTAANALTINSSGSGNLCISSTNGGTCSTTLTNNGGCTIPGSAYSGDGAYITYPTYDCTPLEMNQTFCRSFTNNTSATITFSMPNMFCTNYSSGGNFVIPPTSTRNLCITQTNCCVGPGIQYTVNWSSSDGASGTFIIDIGSTL